MEGNDANRQTLGSESSYPNKAAGGVRRIHVKRSSWQCVYRCCGNSAKTLSRIMFLFHLSFRLFYRYTRTNEGGIQQRTAD